MNTDLYTPFITAHLNEDEAIAKAAAAAGESARWLALHDGSDNYDVMTDDEWLVSESTLHGVHEHIANNDPARVLKQVAAMRLVLAEHERHTLSDDRVYCSACSCSFDSPVCDAEPWPCPTLRALAAFWSDHPGHPDNVVATA